MKLKDWLIRHEKDKKILITDKVSFVNAKIRLLNKEGLAVKNGKVQTIEGLARELVQGYEAIYVIGGKEERVLTFEAVYLLHSLLEEEKGEVLFRFLPKTSLGLKTSEEILRVMNLLREGKRKEIPSLSKKQEGMFDLIAKFEKRMEEKGLLDKVGLLKRAISILEKMEEEDILFSFGFIEKPFFGVEEYADKRFSYLEKTFMDLLFKKLKLSGEKLQMVEENEGNLQFVKAYGQYNEVAYCINQIKENHYPLGDVGIYYTNEVYENYLRGLFENEKLGICFHSESACYKDVVQLVLALIESIEKNFSYELLGKVVNSRSVTLKYCEKTEDREESEWEEEIEENIEEEENSFESRNYSLRYAYKRLLRHENIGWSKERYEDFLKRHESLGEYSTLSSEENEKMAEFKMFLRDYISIYEEENTIEKTFSNLIAFVKKYTYRSKERNVLLSALNENRNRFRFLEFTCKENQLLLLREVIEGLRFSEVEDLGKVRAEKISGKMMAERRYLFIIGLSSSYVMQASSSSPVLSDEEILELVDGNSFYLPLMKTKNEEFREDFEVLLKSIEKGKTTLIYSYYDTVTFSELSPSLLYIERCNEEEEHTYHPLTSGLCFDIEEEASSLQGFLKKEMGKNEVVSLSASSLQKMVECPLRYYYNNVERIEERDKERYGIWLTSAEKGTFFHRIMELYCDEVFKEDGERISAEQEFDEECFERAYQKAEKEVCILVPFPSDKVRENESRLIKEVANQYVKETHETFLLEREEAREWRVLGSELEFGPFVELNIPYTLKDGSEFEWKGSIDRLDGYLDSEGIINLKVIDYKTGSFESIKKKIEGKVNEKLGFTIPGDKELQHYIYAAVAVGYVKKFQKILEKNFGEKKINGAKIFKVLFSLPFEKEENKVYDATEILNSGGISIDGFEYSLHLPERVQEIMNQIIINEQNGNVHELLQAAESYVDRQFEEESVEKYPEKEKICYYCNYRDICRKQIR